MFKRVSRYWICQLAGWGLYAAITVFFYLTLSTRKIEHFYLLILISIALGILFTHLMRVSIKYYKFLEKPIRKQIISFILVTIVFSTAYACADVGFENILNLGGYADPKISLLNELIEAL